MTVSEALPTLTEAEKVKAFDYWLAVSVPDPRSMKVEVDKDAGWGLVEAIAHAIADRKPDLAPWTPGYGDDYHSVGWRGALVSDAWRGITMETEARDFGNVFRAPEDAEAHAARLRVFNRVCQMMTILGWTAHTPKGVFRAMRKYFAYDDTPTAGEYDAIREQLEKEGAL